MEERFEDMMVEVRQLFSETTGSTEEKRQEVLEAIENTYQLAQVVLLPMFLMDIRNVVNFVKRVNESLAVVNEVALEYRIDPFHIKDFDLSIVKVLEKELGKSIDEITAQGE